MRKLLRAAAALTLVGLALMVWSLFQPTPLPVMLAMSLGQAIGTAAFAMFGLAVLVDLRRSRRVRRDSQGLPPLRELLKPPGREPLDSPSLDQIPIHREEVVELKPKAKPALQPEAKAKPEPEPTSQPTPAPAPAPALEQPAPTTEAEPAAKPTTGAEPDPTPTEETKSP